MLNWDRYCFRSNTYLNFVEISLRWNSKLLMVNISIIRRTAFPSSHNASSVINDLLISSSSINKLIHSLMVPPVTNCLTLIERDYLRDVWKTLSEPFSWEKNFWTKFSAHSINIKIASSLVLGLLHSSWAHTSWPKGCRFDYHWLQDFFISTTRYNDVIPLLPFFIFRVNRIHCFNW